jgi:hypothetical protein
MYIAKHFIESLLNETVGYDMREEYTGLLFEWYGDDLSGFDPDDEDLIVAFERLRSNYTFWRTGPYNVSPYQKLRAKYDALLETYMQSIDELTALRHENEQLAMACRKSQRMGVSNKIKGGCGSAKKERRLIKNDRPDAA